MLLRFTLLVLFISMSLMACQTSTIDENSKHENNEPVPVEGKVNGYRGIWFGLKQYSAYGDKYSGGLGTYTASHQPIAIYAPKVDKTFFVYGGTQDKDKRHLLIMISYFDHKTKLVPKPVIVLDKNGVDDPHDNAVLSIDDKGFIWVFASGRGSVRTGSIFRSKEPYDIESFVKIREAEMTYSQPWILENQQFFYFFTKYSKGRELYFSTSPDGVTWRTEKKIAGMGGHYQVSGVSANKAFTAFNYHPNGNVDKRTNLYFMQTEDMGKTWKTVDNTVVTIPVTNKKSLTLVKDYESDGKLVYLHDINVDAAGNPIILFLTSYSHQPGPHIMPREWMVAHWKNGAWYLGKVCESTHNYDTGSIYVDGNLWRIVGPTEAGSQFYGTGGEIAIWESTDQGENWSKVKVVTQNSVFNHSYARRPLHASDEFYALWADGHADIFSQSKLYFTNKTGDTLWELPYYMQNAFEAPIKLK